MDDRDDSGTRSRVEDEQNDIASTLVELTMARPTAKIFVALYEEDLNYLYCLHPYRRRAAENPKAFFFDLKGRPFGAAEREL
jgi:hypothetical protein